MSPEYLEERQQELHEFANVPAPCHHTSIGALRRTLSSTKEVLWRMVREKPKYPSEYIYDVVRAPIFRE